MNKKTIELNGNLYDAVSGKLLTNDTAATVAPATPRPRSTGSNIDGFFRARTTTPTRPAAEKISVLAGPQTAPRPARAPQRHAPNHAKTHHAAVSHQVRRDVTLPVAVHVSKQATEQHHVPINHTKARKPQPSATLMRRAVKRPDASLKKQANAQGALTHTVPGLIEVKHAAAAIDTDRLIRASSVGTSPLVAHHGKEVPKVSPLVAPLAVNAGPSSVPVPVKPQEHVPPTAPAPQPTNNPDPSGKKQNIFDHALANATNYVDLEARRSGLRRHKRNHAISMLAGLFALVIITGFATYQNSPGLQLRVASVQAGLSTGMPNLKAAGFAYTGAKAANGKLTVGFSNSGGRYSLTQQKTSWSAGDMIADIASVSASGKPNYTTVQAGDTTIYRFNNQTATWVADGKWYSISGTTGISNDQVKTIVKSV
ncbi:MAG TPA: hypothetical protein VLF59_06015 [Candidatus Saccharimonadales bacterium]|nr:hypothetical protein [Candidatus Saccharimonadales bacterium]